MINPEPAAVTVRLYAAAAHAAGRDEIVVPASDLATVLAAVTAASADPARVAAVLPQCSVLIDGLIHTGDPTRGLPAGTTVELLPPFAGG